MLLPLIVLSSTLATDPNVILKAILDHISSSGSGISLFTVVSIIIAISGATYAVFVGIRGLWEEKLRNTKRDVNRDINKIEKIGKDGQPSHAHKIANRVRKRIVFWYGVWYFSYAILVLIFALAVYFIAIHTCIKSWANPNILTQRWPSYRLVLVVVILNNFLCLAMALLSCWRINKNDTTFTEWLNSEEQHNWSDNEDDAPPDEESVES